MNRIVLAMGASLHTAFATTHFQVWRSLRSIASRERALEALRKELTRNPHWSSGRIKLSELLIDTLFAQMPEPESSLIEELQVQGQTIADISTNSFAHHTMGMVAYFKNCSPQGSKQLSATAIAVSTDPHPGLDRLKESCSAQEIDLQVTGLGRHYTGNGLIPLLLLEHLKEHVADSELVLAVDAHDVVLYADWKEIIHKFLRLKSPLVFSAEKNCWPDPHFAKHYPPSPTPYRFLNAGCFMGYAGVIKHMISQNAFNPAWKSNQRAYVNYFLSNQNFVSLDYNCELFQNLYGVTLNELSFNKDRFQNLFTGSTPCAIHANGDLGLERLKEIEKGEFDLLPEEVRAPFDPSSQPVLKRILKALLLMDLWPTRVKTYLKGVPHSLKYGYKVVISRLLRVFGKEIDYLYDEEFATLPWRDKDYAEDFCLVLTRNIPTDSVVDVGCGTGDLLAPFHKNGNRILGIDGSSANFKHRKIPDEHFLIMDLRNEKPPEERFDLCMCLEVAEHIEERYTPKLLELLTSLSNTIVFTAAPPGQGGLDHCNEKPRSWWEQEFQKYNFSFDVKLTDIIKKELSSIETSSHASAANLHQYVANLMVLRRSLEGS